MNMGKQANVNRTRPDFSDKNIFKPVYDECRICFQSLFADRKTPVYLRCGHQYHLGSAFNVMNKMQCPTCNQMEHGEWLFAQSSPNPNRVTSLVQPLRGDFAIPPVWRQPMLPSVGFIEPRQRQIAESISSALVANEHRIRMPPSVWDVPGSYNIRRSGAEHRIQSQARGMYGYDSTTGGGERGSYSRGRGCSVVTSDGERRMYGYNSIIDGGERGSYSRGRGFSVVTSGGERRMYGYNSIISGGERASYSRGRGCSIVTSDGDTSRSVGTLQFRPIAMTSSGITIRNGDVTRRSGGDISRMDGTQQYLPMAMTSIISGGERGSYSHGRGCSVVTSGGDISRSGGILGSRPTAMTSSGVAIRSGRSGGDRSRIEGTQSRPMTMTSNGVTIRSGGVTRRRGGDRNRIGGTQQSWPMPSSGGVTSRSGWSRNRSRGYKQYRPSA